MSYTVEQIEKLLTEREWGASKKESVEGIHNELITCMTESPNTFIYACKKVFSSKANGGRK